uniref:Ras association domain family member 2a n=1 Tax=Cyprinus carpio carpio TaxID=630221 RepID=A0A9J7ZPB7_CYPCA
MQLAQVLTDLDMLYLSFISLIYSKSKSYLNLIFRFIMYHHFFLSGNKLYICMLYVLCMQEEEELIIEGLLNISWGLRRPIRLQMQDDHERIRPPPSSTSWHSGCNLDNQSQDGQKQTQTPPQMEVTPPEDQSSNGTTQDHEEEEEEACDVSAQLLRTKSDAGVLRRGRRRSPSDQRRIRRHRFSINGHFYNHKTSVFTPAYGSVTNARINSCMTTPQVLRVLLNKFKIENSPDEFALYLVHASGERVQLKRTDYPLVVRILQGPCEHVCKIFLMEQDLGEEIPYEVSVCEGADLLRNSSL